MKLRSGDERFAAVLDPAQEDDFEVSNTEVSGLEDLATMPDEILVTAPVVGYFRDAKETLKTGNTVGPGAAVCEIVALGIANDVVVKTGGEILEVFVNPGDAVEYGQTLATVRPS